MSYCRYGIHGRGGHECRGPQSPDYRRVQLVHAASGLLAIFHLRPRYRELDWKLSRREVPPKAKHKWHRFRGGDEQYADIGQHVFSQRATLLAQVLGREVRRAGWRLGFAVVEDAHSSRRVADNLAVSYRLDAQCVPDLGVELLARSGRH